jgi:UDP-N-acetylglucosamine/UDP-N-acetylgalactosamine diphosphorylase
VFDVAFLSRVLDLSDALPIHIQHKKVTHLDAEGRLAEPQTPNALKFERFIFDLLPHSSAAIVIEGHEERVFAPLKNAPGERRDTPQFVQARMVKLHRQWLQAAGAKVADDVPVEISPLFAVDEDALRQRIEEPLDIAVPTYLC